MDTDKPRPAILLRRMPPFGDWLICGVSSQVHQQVVGFDEIIELSHPDFLAAKRPNLNSRGCNPRLTTAPGRDQFDDLRITRANREDRDHRRQRDKNAEMWRWPSRRCLIRPEMEMGFIR